MCTNFRAKQTTLTILAQIFPKLDLGEETQKLTCNNNQHRQDAMCATFQEKRTTLTFSTQICPKMDFGV